MPNFASAHCSSFNKTDFGVVIVKIEVIRVIIYGVLSCFFSGSPSSVLSERTFHFSATLLQNKLEEHIVFTNCPPLICNSVFSVVMWTRKLE